jgi:hypothetical protein
MNLIGDIKASFIYELATAAILDTHNYACFIHLTDGDRLMIRWGIRDWFISILA